MGVEPVTNYLTKGGFSAGNIGILTRLVKSQMQQVHLLSNRAEQEVVCLGEGARPRWRLWKQGNWRFPEMQTMQLFYPEGWGEDRAEATDCVRSRLRPTQIFFYCKEGLNFTVCVHCSDDVVKRRACFCKEGLNFAVILPLLFLGLAWWRGTLCAKWLWGREVSSARQVVLSPAISMMMVDW